MAQEELIHILHPDDWVLPGFYQAVEAAVKHNQTAALYATHSVYVDAVGRPLFCPRPSWLSGNGRVFQPIHQGNPLCVAGCVMRKSFYEKWGGWDTRLRHCV